MICNLGRIHYKGILFTMIAYFTYLSQVIWSVVPVLYVTLLVHAILYIHNEISCFQMATGTSSSRGSKFFSVLLLEWPYLVGPYCFRWNGVSFLTIVSVHCTSFASRLSLIGNRSKLWYESKSGDSLIELSSSIVLIDSLERIGFCIHWEK